MKACYRYSKLRALTLYGCFMGIPIIMMMGVLAASINRPEKDIVRNLFTFLHVGLPFFMVPLLLMISKFYVRISIDDTGIVYKSLFKNLALQWSEIDTIRMKYLADFGLMRGGKHLDIRGAKKKRIKVVDFIMNCDTMDSWEGLDEFEATVRKHTLANRPAPMVADSVNIDVTLSC